MKKVLIIFAHPKYEQSKANKALLSRVKEMDHVTVHDIYEEYPDFNIDAKREQAIIEAHNIIIWQHPLYWYSCPALLKHWIDVVLEYGWAYGPKGNALKGKQCISVVTTGVSKVFYCSEAGNQKGLYKFLIPFSQTAKICGMEYLPPYVLMGTHELKGDEIIRYSNQFKTMLDILSGNEVEKAIEMDKNYFNEILEVENL